MASGYIAEDGTFHIDVEPSEVQVVIPTPVVEIPVIVDQTEIV